MDLRPLGRTTLKVTPLALGTMNFGADWHGVGAADEKTAAALLDLALDAGINIIDTADIYGCGASETMLGKLLKGRRQKVLIASKVLGQMKPSDPSTGGLSRKHILKAAEDSLKRLKTDRLDLYMPHGCDPQVPLEESLEAFAKPAQGRKIRVLGVSNFGGPIWPSARAPRPKIIFLGSNSIRFSTVLPLVSSRTTLSPNAANNPFPSWPGALWAAACSPVSTHRRVPVPKGGVKSPAKLFPACRKPG